MASHSSAIAESRFPICVGRHRHSGDQQGILKRLTTQDLLRKVQRTLVLVFRFGVLPRFRVDRGESTIDSDQPPVAEVTVFGNSQRPTEGLGGFGIVSGSGERLAFRYLIAPA